VNFGKAMFLRNVLVRRMARNFSTPRRFIRPVDFARPLEARLQFYACALQPSSSLTGH